MLVTCKALGRRRPLFADWSVPLPPELDNGGGGDNITLADLIECVVRSEVKAFRQRQIDRQFLRALTASEIAQRALKGKVEMGQSEVGNQEIDEEDAVAAALTAFQDGMYLVIIDEVEYKRLEEQVFVTADSRVTFLRLTFLTGA